MHEHEDEPGNQPDQGRQNEERQEDTPTGAGEATRKGTVGGNSNDNRTDRERASDASDE